MAIARGIERLPHLRSRLIMLAGASVLPVLLLSVILGYFLIQHEEELFRQAAEARNRTFLTALDAQIQGYIGTLRALGASSSLESGDLAAFHREAARVLTTQPEWRNILLIDPSGQQLINLRFAFGAPLPREIETYLEAFRATLVNKTLKIGNLAHGPVSDELGIAVRLPILRGGEVRYVLQFILRPAALAKLLELQAFPATWAVGLVDGEQRFIARQPFREVGGKPSANFLSAIHREEEGWFRGRTLEGRDTYTAFGTSALTRWTVGVAIPVTEINAAAYKTAGYMIAGTVLSLLLAIVLAFWAARRLAEPIARLAAAARHLGLRPTSESLTAVCQDPRVQEVFEVASALKEAEISMLDRESLRQREQQALLAADRAKDEFLAMLGHELRNPLSAIVASAHVLRLSKAGAQASHQAHDVIERQSRQMARLVEDLLDVSRLAMGKLTLHRQRMDLGALTQRVLNTWIQTRPERGERVQSDLRSVWIDADRDRMEQILANLLDNAEKFSAGEGRIYVRVAPEGANALLRVEDEGQGISPEDISHVFDLFVQGPQPFNRPQGGIGLGLTLARRLTEMHGGSINVFSAGIGKGATFTVRLPQTDSLALPPVAEATAKRPERRRILVVEDNDDSRAMMETMLTLEGHEVRTASTGAAAVKSASEWVPDVALIDIGLPDVDGYEVARRVRALALVNAPKLIAVSGFGQQSDLHRAYQAGFDLHLTKPVAPQFLRDVMGALTSRHQLTASSK